MEIKKIKFNFVIFISLIILFLTSSIIICKNNKTLYKRKTIISCLQNSSIFNKNKKYLTIELENFFLTKDRILGFNKFYFDEEDRFKSKIYFKDGKCFDFEGKLLHQPKLVKFVMDTEGNIYLDLNNQKRDPILDYIFRNDYEFKHSYFLGALEGASAAGFIAIALGNIIRIDFGSGHYSPDFFHHIQLLHELVDNKAISSSFNISINMYYQNFGFNSFFLTNKNFKERLNIRGRPPIISINTILNKYINSMIKLSIDFIEYKIDIDGCDNYLLKKINNAV